MSQYIVNTKFVFSGFFVVEANNKAEAKEIVDKHCGLALGRDIHSSVGAVDWDFRVHPEKKVTSVKKRRS